MLPLPPQTLLLVGGALLLGRSTACSLDWGAASGSLSLPERGESLRFLGQLKSVPAHRCLRDRTDFRCPWKKGAGAREEWQEATCCYPEVLRQVLHLFGSEDSREAWPEKALEQLLTNVHSDLQDTQRGPAQQQGPSCPPPLAMAIREYFRRISHYLKDKGYGTCSWEIVRAEMQAALSGFAGPAERSPEKRREEKRREEKRREEKRREEKRREKKRRA